MAASRVISPRRGSGRNLSDHPGFLSDERLVAGAKRGQGTAFDELHKRHALKMFRVAHRITRNREDAEDAVQECFLNAFSHLKAFDGRAKFSTWLTRIVINAALMKLRKNRTSREIPIHDSGEVADCRIEDTLPDSLPNPEQRLANSEHEAILRDAIAQLRPSLRKAIEVHKLQECSLPETAQILGISVAAAKTRMFRARAALRGAGVLGRKASKYPWVDSETRAIEIDGATGCVFSAEAQSGSDSSTIPRFGGVPFL